jgi:hypothetical protein
VPPPRGNDGQAQLDAALDQGGHLFFGVRGQDHEGVFDAPVGGVGHVRDAAQAIELDVVVTGDLAQHALGALTQLAHLLEGAGKAVHSGAGHAQHLAHEGVAGAVIARGATLVDLTQAVVQGFDQLTTALGVVQQVVLQVGVALHDPDVAQHFVQHPGGAARQALGAQLAQGLPGALAQQALDDLAVRERGVVIGDLAQAWLAVRVGVGSLGDHVGQLGGCVHEVARREGPDFGNAQGTWGQ